MHGFLDDWDPDPEIDDALNTWAAFDADERSDDVYVTADPIPQAGFGTWRDTHDPYFDPNTNPSLN